MSRTLLALRLVIPAIWGGMIIGLSFIETPLKFQAPGISVPLGLGIGRIVFNALTIAGVIFFVLLVALVFWPPRLNRVAGIVTGAIGVVLAIQIFVIRPALNARSDEVIAGRDPGESWLHYGYIAAELVLLALLVVFIIQAARSLVVDPARKAIPAARE